jgi:hypothetical protein
MRTVTVKVLDDGNENNLMTCDVFCLDAEKFLDFLVTCDIPQLRFNEVSNYANKNLEKRLDLFPLKIAIDGNSEESKQFSIQLSDL